jgi:hypothetical protein
VKATPSARALAWLVDFLDRFWGLVGLAVVIALEVLVFAPRGMTMAMLLGGLVAAGIMAVWVRGNWL